MTKHVGILTSGGDSPGLNAVLRGFGKAGRLLYDLDIIGFRDGFRGLVQDQAITFEAALLSGLLTQGGTILGTSRDKPHRMSVGGKTMDMTDAIVDTYRRRHLDALVCVGGGGTQKNALLLKQAGLNVVTLPKTIDNDIFATDTTVGFDTALDIVTEAIDRLHSTATSHHRIIVVEVMGHRASWLALGAGVAGGADVILIPEIPYDIECVAEAIRERTRSGKRFSIVAMAEGCMTLEDARKVEQLVEIKEHAKSKTERSKASRRLENFHEKHVNHTVHFTEQIEKRTRQESRLTILGHVQRGGSPSTVDRLLATRLGTACARTLHEGLYGVMLALRNGEIEPLPLEEVAGKKKRVPPEHPWIVAARAVGTCMGV